MIETYEAMDNVGYGQENALIRLIKSGEFYS